MTLRQRMGIAWMSARFVVTGQENLWPVFLLYALNRKRRKQGAIQWSETHVSSGLDLAIDGFPGSGNSFFTKFLKKTQDPELKLAHHLHAPNQIMRAVRLGVPAVLVLRQPVDAVCSMHRRFGYPLSAAMKNYVRFYRGLEPFMSGIFITRFEDVTKQPADVVKSLGERFELSLRTDIQSEETEGLWAIGEGLKSLSQEKLAAREKKKEELRARAVAESSPEDVRAAQEIYEIFLVASAKIGDGGKTINETTK